MHLFLANWVTEALCLQLYPLALEGKQQLVCTAALPFISVLGITIIV